MNEPRPPDPFCRLPIPRLPSVPELDPVLQDRVDRGADALEHGMFGWAPEHYKRWLAFDGPLRFKGKVEVRTKEVARLRIARLNECHY
jgi:Carboxymuconolactone decarboxylase family